MYKKDKRKEERNAWRRKALIGTRAPGREGHDEGRGQAGREGQLIGSLGTCSGWGRARRAGRQGQGMGGLREGGKNWQLKHWSLSQFLNYIKMFFQTHTFTSQPLTPHSYSISSPFHFTTNSPFTPPLWHPLNLFSQLFQPVTHFSLVLTSMKFLDDVSAKLFSCAFNISWFNHLWDYILVFHICFIT